MNTNEIRQSFLDFFQSEQHTVVPSSSLVPGNDPTLLFTNAGMVQFKDVFLGHDQRAYVRAVSSQRCVRAGGKHNDLENVGYTARHHTFFEMLGNFSFGDYFKRDAIRYAWELLTTVWKLPADKLWITVYHTDDEAFEVWTRHIGVPAERVIRIGDNKGAPYASDNFWSMGDTGPCGPCSEIFYDHGPELAGGPPGSADEDGDRYIEIWNLVFMQFDRSADGALTPLPAPCVDTGMGLERIAAVLQGVHSNYEIDLFRNLIKAAAKVTGCKDLENNSLKVIADHIRACAFLITDGVLPSNEGRGYVLRRIMRRAIRHGYKLGQEQPFFHKLVDALDSEMGDAYPELRKQKKQIATAILQEEERFAETLGQGMKLLDEYTNPLRRKADEIANNYNLDFVGHEIEFNDKNGIFGIERHYKDRSSGKIRILQIRKEDYANAHSMLEVVNGRKGLQHEAPIFILVRHEGNKNLETVNNKILQERNDAIIQIVEIKDLQQVALDGRSAFTLYDTYGFPLDLTADILRERGIPLDVKGFEREMQAQRERAREASKFGMDYGKGIKTDASTEFTGYDSLQGQGKVLALFRDNVSVPQLAAGEDGAVVLDRTPFYAESGGQVGDQGLLETGSMRFAVADTQKRGAAHVHFGKLSGSALAVGDTVTATVNRETRSPTVLNHSATHLLHAALRHVLGAHVTQKGSLVAPDRLRFDFSHGQPMTAEEIQAVEDMVNTEIRRNHAADVKLMGYDDAIKAGAMALFGEKYGNEVRVMKFGEFSTELCGGTHVARTGDIGLFKIVSEGGVAAGVRRIEAVTGAGALTYVRETEDTLRQIAGDVKADRATVTQRVGQLAERNRALEKELDKLRAKLASGQGGDIAAQAVDVAGVKVLAARLDGADAKALRDAVDQMKNKLGSAAVVLAAVEDGKVRLAAGVTKDQMAKVPAGELVNLVAQQVGGKGGGRPDMAQAGGTDPTGLDAALASVPAWVREQFRKR